MKHGNLEISKVYLLSGEDLSITNSVKIKHPKIKDILELGHGVYCENYYWSYVSTLLCDPYANAVWLDDRGIDYEEVSAFKVLIMKLEETVNIKTQESQAIQAFYTSALQFFLGEREYIVKKVDEDNNVIIDGNDENFLINEQIFDYIVSFIKLINGFSDKNKINPKNKSAKKILIEDMRSEQRKKLKNPEKDEDSDVIGDFISGLMNGSYCGVTPFNFKDLPIFVLIDSMNATEKRANYQSVLSGIYAGTIKKDKSIEKMALWMKSS